MATALIFGSAPVLAAEHGHEASADQLHEYEAALLEYPNRYRGLYGASRAAEAAGQREMATDYYRRLLALAKNADSARPEAAVAKAYLASQ
ncbi:hypothetical protein AU476_38510 [Cupriavidus sp. UYMSc13B]|nr:hypothetical protein AU476_38510 [Cupriavidus sp. UYMSc13B]